MSSGWVQGVEVGSYDNISPNAAAVGVVVFRAAFSLLPKVSVLVAVAAFISLCEFTIIKRYIMKDQLVV